MSTVYLYTKRYVSRRTGRVRYYPNRQFRLRAPDRCALDLTRTDLQRVSDKRWSSGRHTYQDSTVQQLVRAGKAVFHGEHIVRLADA